MLRIEKLLSCKDMIADTIYKMLRILYRVRVHPQDGHERQG